MAVHQVDMLQAESSSHQSESKPFLRGVVRGSPVFYSEFWLLSPEYMSSYRELCNIRHRAGRAGVLNSTFYWTVAEVLLSEAKEGSVSFLILLPAGSTRLAVTKMSRFFLMLRVVLLLNK